MATWVAANCGEQRACQLLNVPTVSSNVSTARGRVNVRRRAGSPAARDLRWVLGMTTSKGFFTTPAMLVRAVALLASLGASACGPLCGLGEHQAQEYQVSQACTGTVEAPASLGLPTAPSPTCGSPLFTAVSCDLIAACLQAPSTENCPVNCLPIDVVMPSNGAAGVEIAIDLPPGFASERTFAASDLRIRAFRVDNRSTPLNPGEPLTVTGGSVKVRMVPNDITATVSLDLQTAAGDPVALQNVQFHETGNSVDYCARAD
jgi:hypothetical protein